MSNLLTPASADQCGFSSCWHFGYYKVHTKIKYDTHWIPGREVGLIKLLYSFLIFVFQFFNIFYFYWSYRLGGGAIICYCSCLGFCSPQKTNYADFYYKPNNLFFLEKILFYYLLSPYRFSQFTFTTTITPFSLYTDH